MKNFKDSHRTFLKLVCKFTHILRGLNKGMSFSEANELARKKIGLMKTGMVKITFVKSDGEKVTRIGTCDYQSLQSYGLLKPFVAKDKAQKNKANSTFKYYDFTRDDKTSTGFKGFRSFTISQLVDIEYCEYSIPFLIKMKNAS